VAPGSASFTNVDGYDRHAGRYSPGLAAQLVDVAGIEPGMRALDVGCGPGALTLALAGRVGADRVAAIDPSEPFARACAERVPGADVRVASAERLPFGDGEFDAVVCQLVINFLDDAAAGVAEMRRVARPGGVVAAAVWDYADRMMLLRRFWDAAVAVDPRAAAKDESRVMRHCSPEGLEGLWRAAGLEDVRTGEVVVSAQYESFNDLWAPLELGVGPAGAFVVAQEPARRAAIRDELRRGLGEPRGPFSLDARAWWVVGRAP
jgi:SAM-dependent methyltransferase